MRSVVLAACLCLPFANAQAQAHKTTPLGDYLQESWTTADGLPHSLVSDMVQTPQGYLWFATWEGAVRYDGHRFDVFDETVIPGLPDRGATELELGLQGQVLLGTARGGLARAVNEQWQIIDTDLGRGAPSIYALLDTGKNLLIGTAGDGLLSAESDGKTRRIEASNVDLGSSVHALLASDAGFVWVGTDKGLFTLENGELQAWGAAHGLPVGTVSCLLKMPDGSLIIGADYGAYRVSESGATPVSTELPAVAVESLLRDRHGNLWIGTAAKGLFRLSQGRLESLASNQGLPNNRISSILEDNDGSVWVGTNGGLLRLREAPFRAITTHNGLPDNYVRAVFEDAAGDVWIGTSAGLAQVKKDGTVLPVTGALAGESILSIDSRSADDGFWIGSYFAGLMHWKNGEIVARYQREQGLPGNQVRAVVAAPDGSVWIGTSSGLAQLKNGKVQTFFQADGLPGDHVISLMLDTRGRLWVGTTLGLAWLEDGKIQAVRHRVLGGVQRIYGMNEDADGVVWVATDNGMARWKNDTWARVGPEQGLPVAALFGVNIDHNGDFWFSSNRGVVRVGATQMDDVLEGRAIRVVSEIFAEADGMASGQCNGASGPTSLVAKDGRVWFGTALGVSVIDPQRLQYFPRSLPAVVIEKVTVDGQDRAVDKPLTLATKNHRLEIQFVGLNYLTPGKTRYRYRLDGFDTDWVPGGRDRIAQFTGLAPGTYRFRGSASNASGEWSVHEAVLDITVPGLWWQQRKTWITATAALAGLFGLAWFIRRRGLKRH